MIGYLEKQLDHGALIVRYPEASRPEDLGLRSAGPSPTMRRGWVDIAAGNGRMKADYQREVERDPVEE